MLPVLLHRSVLTRAVTSRQVILWGSIRRHTLKSRIGSISVRNPKEQSVPVALEFDPFEEPAEPIEEDTDPYEPLVRAIKQLDEYTSGRSKQKIVTILDNVPSSEKDADTAILERLWTVLDKPSNVVQRSAKNYIGRPISNKAEESIVGFPLALDKNSFQRYLDALVFKRYAAPLQLQVDCIIEDLVFNKLVQLELQLTQSSLNTMLMHWARRNRLDLIAKTLTRFLKIDLMPDLTSFHIIFYALQRQFSSGKLDYSKRALYVTRLLYAMRLSYNINPDVKLCRIIVRLLKEQSSRRELLVSLPSYGMDLHKCLPELGYALHEEGTDYNTLCSTMQTVLGLDEEPQFNSKNRKILYTSMVYAEMDADPPSFEYAQRLVREHPGWVSKAAVKRLEELMQSRGEGHS